MHLFSTVSKADTSFLSYVTRDTSVFSYVESRHPVFNSVESKSPWLDSWFGLCWKQIHLCFQQCLKQTHPFFQQCSMQKHCSSICFQPCWKQMCLFSTVWKADTPVFSCLESRHNCFFNSISGSRLLSSNSSLRPLRQSLLLADTVHWVQTVSMLTLTAAVR